MAETVFDKLVQEISPNERQDLLQQISRKASVSEESLRPDEPEPKSVDLAAVYRGLGFFSRLIIYLKMLFTGRGREDVLERELLANIARDIQKKSPGLMNFSAGVFLPAFCEEITMLKDSAQIFLHPLSFVEGGSRGDFIAFLAGLLMENIQARFFRETDPYYLAASVMRNGQALFTPGEWENRRDMELPLGSEISDAEMKKMMNSSLEGILAAIPADGKTLMYQNMKVLHHLVSLSRFSFTKLISAFSSGPEGVPSPCPISRLKAQVIKLAEIMCNMKSPPSPVLTRVLFLFSNQEKSGSALEAEAVRQISQANRALENIREINRRIPWLLIARYASRNPNYSYTVSGGAEDWFAVLKQFWRERVEAQYRDFTVQRRERDLRREIRGAFDPVTVQEVSGYSFPVDGHTVSGAYPLSLSLAKTFLEAVFPGELSGYLKAVLIDGVFYNENNRKEFSDGFNALLKAAVMLEKFEARLTPNGDVTLAVKANMKEYAPAALKRRKIRHIVQGTDLDAEYLLQTVQGGLHSLLRTINGILYGETGGTYDTLSNLSYLGGTANAAFRGGLDASLRKLSALNGLLQKLVPLEKGWQESRGAQDGKA
ncbi:MAG: DUF5312 domain-containing protein [Spirochaetia bacterium]|jgi:hypothetical protein|nr:DUF5312 domain-containing protein [Spirochaetia bacterium]